MLVIVLCRNCQRRREEGFSSPNKDKLDGGDTPTKKSSPAKFNGFVSPSKKKYDVGGDGKEKPPSADYCIEMSEDVKLLPPQESPTISNGGAKKTSSNSGKVNTDSASDEKRELTANTDEGDDEKGSLVVNT